MCQSQQRPIVLTFPFSSFFFPPHFSSLIISDSHQKKMLMLEAVGRAGKLGSQVQFIYCYVAKVCKQRQDYSFIFYMAYGRQTTGPQAVDWSLSHLVKDV